MPAPLSCAASAFSNCLLSPPSTSWEPWGTLFCAAGFAVIFPWCWSASATASPTNTPGVFTGIFPLGPAGGMLVPWTVDWPTDLFGIGS